MCWCYNVRITCDDRVHHTAPKSDHCPFVGKDHQSLEGGREGGREGVLLTPEPKFSKIGMLD